jgi:hypothetical protein
MFITDWYDPVLYTDPTGKYAEAVPPIRPMCPFFYAWDAQRKICVRESWAPSILAETAELTVPLLPGPGMVATGTMEQLGGQVAGEAAKQAFKKLGEACGLLVAYWLGQQVQSNVQTNVQSQPDQVLNYDVKLKHIYGARGRAGHPKSEAEVRAGVRAAFEWWYSPGGSAKSGQQLFAGIAGSISGPVMIIKYNATLNIVNTAYYVPTLQRAHEIVIYELKYNVPVAIAPIS